MKTRLIQKHIVIDVALVIFMNCFRDINMTNIGQVTSLIKIKTDSVICTRLFEQVCHLLVFSSEQLYNLAKPMDQINFPLS